MLRKWRFTSSNWWRNHCAGTTGKPSSRTTTCRAIGKHHVASGLHFGAWSISGAKAASAAPSEANAGRTPSADSRPNMTRKRRIAAQLSTGLFSFLRSKPLLGYVLTTGRLVIEMANGSEETAAPYAVTTRSRRDTGSRNQRSPRDEFESFCSEAEESQLPQTSPQISVRAAQRASRQVARRTRTADTVWRFLRPTTQSRRKSRRRSWRQSPRTISVEVDPARGECVPSASFATPKCQSLAG